MGIVTAGESVPLHSDKDLLAAGYRNLTDAQIASLASNRRRDTPALCNARR